MSSINLLRRMLFSLGFLAIQVSLLILAVFHYNPILATIFLPFLVGTFYYWWRNYQKKRQDLVQCLKVITRKWDERKPEHPPCFRWKLAIGLLQIDNLEDAIQTIEKVDKLLFTAEIGRILEEWAQSFGGFLQKYDEERYLILLDNAALRQIEEKRFNVLDGIRSLDLGNKIPVTVSLGIGLGADSLGKLGEYAQAALNVALGRGGDQAVIKDEDVLRFYGGKTQTPEKRTRIRARVIAHALRDLIEEANRVVIMGHKEMDLDSCGAAMGIARIVRSLGKEAYVLLDDHNPAIDKLEKYLTSLDAYQDIFVLREFAVRVTDEQTLLVIVDTHKPSLVIEEALLSLTDKIVVIDHHRQAGEFVFEPILIYLEPYASSTSELVTEIVEYLDNVHLEPAEATSLLAGITVDTKNFTFQTGVRTFEAASFLRRWGADPVAVRELLKDNLASFVKRAEVVKNLEILYNSIAVGVYPEISEKAQLVAAQAADTLLNIEGIKASFVLCPCNKEGVVVSARSLGDINVQVILEKLGGGGHLTVAGAQIREKTLEEARARVKEIIEEYWREERMNS